MLLSVLSGRRLQGIFALTLVSLLGSVVLAAAQGSGAVIFGTIQDAQGGALPGVSLTVLNIDSGTTRTSVTEGNGEYRIAALPPGRYELKAELQGFTPAEVKDFTLTIGLEIKRDLTMTLQGVQESVTVTGAAPIVEPTRSGVGSVVTLETINILPVENRAPTQLALMLPGTGNDTVRPQRPNAANVGAGGMTHFSTNYLVDGADNMSIQAGEPRMDFPQASIREFSVSQSSGAAEYGGRTGGTVQVVTKSGTNLFTGEAFEYFRDASLNTLNKFEERRHDEFGEPKPEYRRHQLGAAFGGPIVRNRLHFFTSVERWDEQQPFTVDTGQPRFYSALEGTFPGGQTTNLGFSRGDLQISPHQNFFVRYAYQGPHLLCDGCGGTRAATSGPDQIIPRASTVVGHTWVVGNRGLNEFIFQKSWQWHQQGPAGNPNLNKLRELLHVYTPERYRYGTATYVFPSLTWGNNSELLLNQNIYELKNAFTWSFGEHAVKTGAAFQSFQVNTDAFGNFLGTWTFGVDQPFDGTAASLAKLTNPIQFTAAFPSLPRQVDSHVYSVYLQDSWRPWANLTLNLGVRYERQTRIWNEDRDMATWYPRPLPLVDFTVRGGKNNVAPRLGAAWDVRKDGRSVMRVGYGVVYQVLLNGTFAAETVALRQSSVNIRNPSYPDPYGGRDPASFVSTAPPNIQIVDNDLVHPRSYTSNLGFSQQLGPVMGLHVDGLYVRITDFLSTVRINTPNPVAGQRPLPAWGVIQQTQSAGTATYRGLLVRLEKRLAARHQYMVSYTLAKQDNNWNGGTGGGGVTNFYNPGADQGPANNDRRHALVTSGAMLLPWNVTLGLAWTVRSTMPFSALAGRDLNVDGANTDYVPGTTKSLGNRDNAGMLAAVNAWRAQNGRGPIPAGQIDTNRYSRVDLRANKAISLGGSRKLDLIAQVFNVLGTDNLLDVGGGWETNALSDSFGSIKTAQARRQAELAVRVVW